MRIEFVMPGGHAPQLLEAAEKPLNGVALGVTGWVVGPRVATLAPARNPGAAIVLATAPFRTFPARQQWRKPTPLRIRYQILHVQT